MLLIAVLFVCVATWLAWVVIDLAVTPLRVARARQREQAADAFGLLPEFVDTQATWMAPGQDPADAAGWAVQFQQAPRRRDVGLVIDADG